MYAIEVTQIMLVGHVTVTAWWMLYIQIQFILTIFNGKVRSKSNVVGLPTRQFVILDGALD